MGIFSILLVATLFSIYCSYRLFIRKKKQILPNVFYYVKSSKFDMYWIFIFLTFICIMGYALIAFWASKNVSFVIIGGLGGLTIILYLNSYLHYAMNDYKVL